MAAALTIISWTACVVALVPTVTAAMAIKFQEDRESKRADTDFEIEAGESYFRRYRFLWATLPAAFLLLFVVAIPTFMCNSAMECEPTDTATGLFVVSLVVGLVTWSVTVAYLANRYFYTRAERPFRRVVGSERAMLLLARALSVITVALPAVAILK